jgi:hypothetical protein
MHLRKRDHASSKKSYRTGEIQGDESADVDGAHGPWRRSLSSESGSGERIFSLAAPLALITPILLGNTSFPYSTTATTVVKEEDIWSFRVG